MPRYPMHRLQRCRAHPASCSARDSWVWLITNGIVSPDARELTTKKWRWRHGRSFLKGNVTYRFGDLSEGVAGDSAVYRRAIRSGSSLAPGG